MKLTRPQLELLRDVAAGGSAVDSYPPAKKLVALGLCTRESVGFSDRLKLTPAGRDALEKERGDD